MYCTYGISVVCGLCMCDSRRKGNASHQQGGRQWRSSLFDVVVSSCGINFGRFAVLEDLLTRCRSTLAAMANSIDRFPASFGRGWWEKAGVMMTIKVGVAGSDLSFG